jgi:phosphoribosylformylglycinamidine synthase II
MTDCRFSALVLSLFPSRPSNPRSSTISLDLLAEHTSSPEASKPWRDVALSDAEYALLVTALGREPATVELGMFGAMWSEHCGYKHSRLLLRDLPTTAPWVLQGPGENAGAVDIGDGLAVVFKVESHNHPSAVEPFQGAATGVGGIVRDIFTMGARPIAILDALRFGDPGEPRTAYLLSNVVAGIGGYGNCLGIPTVGGELFFDASFNGNPLVNAMCVGIATHESLTRAAASGVGNAIVLLGAGTGRDGLHGATFASVEDPEASHRGVIQVGHPFLEKQLMEACLQLLSEGEVVAMQDLGAAGLTSSLVECASRGGTGAEIEVNLVHRREAGMSAYEVMLSESQERMLLVVEPDHMSQVHVVANRWGLQASEIGRVTDDGIVRVTEGGAIVAEVESSLFVDRCPTYDLRERWAGRVHRPVTTSVTSVPDLQGEEGERSAQATLLRLLHSPNIGSRRPIWERFDHTIQTNTVVPPGVADAAVLRVKGTTRAVAMAIDCNSRYCSLDPWLGAAHAVAESTRNISCVGGRPLALTNCLNFGNPERRPGAEQLPAAVAGMAEAARRLGVPVVSGNVSLYNETADGPVMPTPTVGAVGVIDEVDRHATAVWQAGDDVYLVGPGEGHLGGSEYLATEHDIVEGPVPPLDLDIEAKVQRVVQSAIAAGEVRTAHDCGLGGLAVALAEMALVSELGADIDQWTVAGEGRRMDARLFGEAPSRIIVACAATAGSAIERRCHEAGAGFRRLGAAGGDRLRLAGAIDVSLVEARVAYESALDGLL